MDSAKGQRLVFEAAIAALELDPTLVVARSFATTARLENWNWTDEIAALEAAARAAPNDVRVLFILAYDLTQSGYFEEALTYAQRIVELDPLSALGYGEVATALSALGRRDEAHEFWRQGVETGDANNLNYAACELFASGEYEAAIDSLEQYYRAVGKDPGAARSFVEGSLDPESGKEFLEGQIQAMVANASNHADVIIAYRYFLAFGYLDDFWAVVEQIESQPNAGWTNADLLEHDCAVLSASGCARHPANVPYKERNSMTALWDVRGAPDTCSKTEGNWLCE